MLIQWHLLMEQLQQSDEAYESLAGDMATTGTQSEPPNAKTAQSGIALKTLHQKLGNQGFQQFVEMKQASLQAATASKAASKYEAKTEVSEKLQAEFQALPELDIAPKKQDEKQSDKDTLKQTEQSADEVNTVKEPSSTDDKAAQVVPEVTKNEASPEKASGSHEQIITVLSQDFKRALPLPSNTLWQSLEKQYLQLQSRQQAKLVYSLSAMLKARSNDQIQVFLDGIKEVSSLHVVQAVLAKIMPLVSIQETVAVEDDEPTEPEED